MYATTFSSLFATLAVLRSVFAAPNFIGRGETHKVEIINKCGSGRPVFLSQTHGERGPGQIDGPVAGGVAYLADYQDCKSSGVNCGTVEFSLINPDRALQYPLQNSINYSLLFGPDPETTVALGNHHFTYPMNAQYTGPDCSAKILGPCLGESKAMCPGVFLYNEPKGGAPFNCLADNAGIRITFC